MPKWIVTYPGCEFKTGRKEFNDKEEIKKFISHLVDEELWFTVDIIPDIEDLDLGEDL